jgi:hypothetical protein
MLHQDIMVAATKKSGVWVKHKFQVIIRKVTTAQNQIYLAEP